LIRTQCSLADAQPDPWPVLYCLCKNVSRFVEIIAGIKQAIDLHAIARLIAVNSGSLATLARDPLHVSAFGRADFLPAAQRQATRASL
jgi:hypothetical protein